MSNHVKGMTSCRPPESEISNENSNLSENSLKESENLQPTCNQLATDYISREAAIASAISGRIRTLPTTEDGENWIRVSEVRESLKAVPSAQPEQHWIPCGERLPEEYGEYLITKKAIGWNCEEHNLNDIAYFDNKGFHKADDVIAWMPLPEAYQEEGEE